MGRQHADIFRMKNGLSILIARSTGICVKHIFSINHRNNFLMPILELGFGLFLQQFLKILSEYQTPFVKIYLSRFVFCRLCYPPILNGHVSKLL